MENERAPLTSALNICDNRSAAKYTSSEQLARVLWAAGRILFRFSPRPCFAWRRFLLRRFGATIGSHVNTYPSTRIYFPWKLVVGDWSAIGEDVLIYNLGTVTIGSRCTISHGAQLCAGTHDYTRRDFVLLKPPITVGDEAWVCTGAFVGPGVTVGEGAVVGACAVAMKDVDPWTVVTGNPARFLKTRTLE
jgi:putative colanic acid biosynthesis acetyltransferase WcaF